MCRAPGQNIILDSDIDEPIRHCASLGFVDDLAANRHARQSGITLSIERPTMSTFEVDYELGNVIHGASSYKTLTLN